MRTTLTYSIVPVQMKNPAEKIQLLFRIDGNGTFALLLTKSFRFDISNTLGLSRQTQWIKN